ncbi:hypothetical protein GGI07_000896 [Coemansia sp. Benny D115]|nr:hypothetical protein GGI07_000896 [Coemansia sp. Benny D115]
MSSRQQQLRQQQIKQRQRFSQLKAEEEQKLKLRLNAIYSNDILNIARHFGNRPEATSAQVIDIDDKGITIEWKWNDSDSDNKSSSTEEMQFAFRESTSPGSALQEISDLACEAHRALGITEKPQLTRDKEAVESRILVSFEFAPPSIPTMAAVLFALVLLGYLAFSEEVHPSLQFIRGLVSQSVCYYIFVFALGIHVVESLIVCGVCQLIKTFQPRQMSTANQIKWTIGGVLFGMFCLHNFVSRILRQFAVAESIRPPTAGHAKRM